MPNQNKPLEDLKMEDPWRVFRIMAEFVEGFHQLSEIGPAVSIFGSARTDPKNKWYKDAVETSRLLVKENFAVITGGGPGIMEAGNRGAAHAKGQSIGLNIDLPFEAFFRMASRARSTAASVFWRSMMWIPFFAIKI